MMDSDFKLSVGSLQQILDGQKPANPIVQIIGFKPLGVDQTAFGQSTEELRYRLMIGDGATTYQYCIITNQDLVQELKMCRIEKWSVIKMTSYQIHDTENTSDPSKRRMIYIMNLEMVEKGSRIGKKLTVDPASIPAQTRPVDLPHQNTPVAASNNNGSYNQQQNGNRGGYEPTQPQPYPMQQNMGRSPAPMRSNHESHIIGIGELTPYIGKWVVKGRVTSKSGIREYNNAKGGGKLFSFTMADKTGEIKITAFNTDCERVHPYIEANKVYILGRAQVKSADKRYTSADFEITLNQDSLVEEVTDSAAASDVPLAKFNFVSIASLADTLPNQPVDLIGAIISVEEVTTVMSRTKNKELKKRNVLIVDMSRATISVTIWGEGADTFQGRDGDIFVTKAARIGNYGGRSASAGDCIFVNPEIPEVRKIKGWYANLVDQNFTNLTSSQESSSSGDNWRTLVQLNDLQQMKMLTSAGNQTQFSRVKAILMSVGRNPVYKCCQTEGCGKKLVDTQSGDMQCQKCGQTFSHAKYRYKTDVEIEDAGSSSWVTLWDEKAEALFGLKPEEMERHMKMDNKEVYERLLTKPNFTPYVFTLKSRIETYNNEERVKHTVHALAPLDQTTFGKHLMTEIKAIAN